MKKTLAVLLILIMLLSLGGCAPSQSAGSPPPAPGGTQAPASSAPEAPAVPKETVTLQFWGGVQGEYGYDALVENFNNEFKDKGIQLEYTRYVNDGDGNLQLDTYLASGNTIDIFMGYGGTTRYNKRVDAGLCLDMTDALKAAGFDPVAELGENNVAPYDKNGRFFALPTKTDNKAWMMVNVNMFEEAGIALPLKGWTYAQYLDACAKLTKGTGIDKTYAMYWSFAPTTDFFRESIGTPLGSNSLYKDDAKETNYDSPVWKGGFDLAYKTIDSGYAYGWDDEVSDSLDFANTFLAGKCAMALGISNIRIVRDFATYPHDFTTALVPFPVPDESYMNVADHSAAASAGDLICINAKTAHVQECIDFVIWYIKGGMAPLASGGRVPLWKGFDSASVVNALNEGAEGAFLPASVEAYLAVGDGIVRKVWTTDKDPEINTIFNEELQAVMYGQKGVDKAVADLKSRADALLK